MTGLWWLAAETAGTSTTPIAVALIAALAAAVPGVLAFRASSKANDLSARKVDQEAYDRAVNFYARQVDDATRQVDRVTAQLDRVTAQLDRVNADLEKEQSGNSTLRRQLRTLEQTVEVLNGTIIDLKARLAQRIQP